MEDDNQLLDIPFFTDLCRLNEFDYNFTQKSQNPPSSPFDIHYNVYNMGNLEMGLVSDIIVFI